MKPVRVEPEAKQELAAAAAWYEQRREGPGRELLAEIGAVFTAIAQSPTRFRFTHVWQAISGFVAQPLDDSLTRSPSSSWRTSFVSSRSPTRDVVQAIGLGD